MRDFLEQDVYIGDEVIYMTDKLMLGTVTDISNGMMIIDDLIEVDSSKVFRLEVMDETPPEEWIDLCNITE